MQCLECKGEVPTLQFYCPYCRAEMPFEATSGIVVAAENAAQADKRESAERAAAQRRRGPRLHSRKMYEIGWQCMQWILVLGALVAAFLVYKYVNWQSAADRMNEVASAVRPVEAAGTPPKAGKRNAIASSPKKPVSEIGLPLALQPTATAGLLVVKSPAATARIFVDGKYVGNTPYSFTVNAGEHKLQLEAEGFQVWTRTVALRGNQQMGIVAALEK